MKVLIVGMGSIGKRYADILQKMDHVVWGSDPYVDKMPKGVMNFAHVDDLDIIDAVFICSPPSLHFKQAIMWTDKHLFIEKPLATSLVGIEGLVISREKMGKVDMVSCNMRYDPLIKKAYDLIFIQEKIGKVLCVKTDFGYYLPDWPDGSEREIPGIVLDCIHEIDLLMWMHGDPTDVKYQGATYDTAAGRFVGTVDAIMVFDKVLANIHMDYYRRKKKREIEWVGTEGVVTYVSNRSVKDPSGETYLSWVTKDTQVGTFDSYIDFAKTGHDEPYKKQVEAFFKAIKYNTCSPNPISQAKDVLKVALEIQGEG